MQSSPFGSSAAAKNWPKSPVLRRICSFFRPGFHKHLVIPQVATTGQLEYGQAWAGNSNQNAVPHNPLVQGRILCCLLSRRCCTLECFLSLHRKFALSEFSGQPCSRCALTWVASRTDLGHLSWQVDPTLSPECEPSRACGCCCPAWPEPSFGVHDVPDLAA